jgi:hypothetical protein
LDFPPPPPNKQSRSDIDDKFGKFEIKKLLEGIYMYVIRYCLWLVVCILCTQKCSCSQCLAYGINCQKVLTCRCLRM